MVAVVAGVARIPVAAASGRKVVGVVIRSTAASSASAPLIGGETLTSGDLVQTARGGNALVRLAANTQVSLGAQTAVRFKSDLDRLVVEMASGATMTRRTGNDPVVVETPGFRVEPAEQGIAVYIVAMLPDKTDVAARTGKLVITDVGSGRRTFVSEGEVAEITGAPSTPPVPQEQESGKQAPGKPAGQQSGQAPSKTAQKPKNHNGIIILAGAAAAAAGIGLAAAAGGGGGGGLPPSSPASP